MISGDVDEFEGRVGRRNRMDRVAWFRVSQTIEERGRKINFPHTRALRMGSRGFRVGLTRAEALRRRALMSLFQHCHGLPLTVNQRHQG